MLKRLLFVMCFMFMFISCSVQVEKKFETEENSMIVKTENIKDCRWREDSLICIISSDNGSILFGNDMLFSFENITKKSFINFYEKSIVLIPEKPFLIITYDDASASDWNAYLIHKLYTPVVPAEISVIMGGYGLEKEKLIEMCKEGNWEPVSHSFSHTRFERLRLQNNYKAGDNKIYGWFVHTFIDDNEVLIGNDKYKILSHSTDENGQYFVVSPNLIKDYDSLSFIELTDEQIEKELTENIHEFEEDTGLSIKHFTWPYTVYDQRTQDKVTKCFYSARAYNGKNLDDSNNLIDGGLNYYPFSNRYTLNSANYVDYFTEDEILLMLAKCKQSNATMIQFGHSWDSQYKYSKLI